MLSDKQRPAMWFSIIGQKPHFNGFLKLVCGNRSKTFYFPSKQKLDLMMGDWPVALAIFFFGCMRKQICMVQSCNQLFSTQCWVLDDRQPSFLMGVLKPACQKLSNTNCRIQSSLNPTKCKFKGNCMRALPHVRGLQLCVAEWVSRWHSSDLQVSIRLCLIRYLSFFFLWLLNTPYSLVG